MITVCSYLQQAVLRFHYGMVSLFAINCSTVEESAFGMGSVALVCKRKFVRELVCWEKVHSLLTK